MITKNLIKNYIFEFVVQDYKNKAQYGQEPTSIEYFYNNRLIRSLVETGIIDEDAPVESIIQKYKNEFLDITWQALEELVRDRIVKRRLKTGGDLSRWDLYVPTEKGLETWSKYGKLLIVPSNLVDSLREDVPALTGEAEVVLEFINEAVYCYFYNLMMGCSLCLSSAVKRAVRAVAGALSAYLQDQKWTEKVKNTANSISRIDLIHRKLKELLDNGALVNVYKKKHPNPSPVIVEEIKSYRRSMEFVGSIISLSQREDGTPSPGIVRIDETYRQELMLGYLVGSYSFFHLNFIMVEMFETLSRARDK